MGRIMGRTGSVSVAALVLMVAAGLTLNPLASIAQGCVWERRDLGQDYLEELKEDLDRLMREIRDGSETLESFGRPLGAKRILMGVFPNVEFEGGGETFRFNQLFDPLERTDFWLEYALIRDTLGNLGGSPHTVRDALSLARDWQRQLERIENLPNAVTRRLRAMDDRLDELTRDYVDGRVDHERLRREIRAIVNLKMEIINSIRPVFRAEDGSELITFRTLYRILYRIDYRISAASTPQVFRSKSRVEWVAEAELYVERLEIRLREAGCLGEPEPSPSPT